MLKNFRKQKPWSGNSKTLLIFPKMKPCTYNPKPTQKKFVYFCKWTFLAKILKKFLYFLKGKLFLYFWKHHFLAEILNKFFYFRKRNSAIFCPRPKNKRTPPWENFLRESFSYTLGNGNLRKASYILRNRNLEKVLYVSKNGTFK